MIHKNRKTRLVKIECDGCAKIFDPGTTSLMEALDAAEEAGWSQHPLDNKKYEHHCSAECRHACERGRGDV